MQRTFSIRLIVAVWSLLTIDSALWSQEVPEVLTLTHPSKNFERHCWGIAEDCEGLLYTATAAGVSIFNGYEWITAPLPYNRIARSLQLGEDCRVYVGGFEIFGYIDHSESGNPRYVPVGDTLLHGTNEEIWRIMVADEGMIVQSFSDIYSYDYSYLTAIPHETNIRLGASVRQQVIIPLINGGISAVIGSKLVEIIPPPEDSEMLRVSGIAEAPRGMDFLVASERKGLFAVSGKTISPLRSAEIDLITQQQINEIKQLSSGALAVGTVLNGLYIIDSLRSITYHINKQNGLSSNGVIALYEDHLGNIWVGTDGGINVVRLNGRSHCYYDNRGILGTIYSTAFFKDERLMASNHGLFRRGRDGSITLVQNSQGQAWSLLAIKDKLLCGHNNGTYRFDGTSLDLISDITGGWWMQTVDTNAILQATYTGLILLSQRDSGWTSARLRSGNVLMRKFVLAGQTMAGYHSRYGLCIAKLSDDYREVIEKKFINNLAGMPIDPAIGMFVHDGKVILSWSDSLYTVLGTELAPVARIDDTVFLKDRIFRDKVSSYDLLMEAGNSFDLANMDHNTLAPGKSYIFNTEYGYAIAPVDSRPEDVQVAIDHLVVGGIRKPLTALSSLNSRERNFIIQLRKVNDITADLSLSYMLEPSDDTWLPVPSSGTLSFQNLAAGSYSLHIADRFGNQKVLASFTVPNPWYRSWPGSILYSCIILGAFLLWNKRVEKRMALKARQKHQEEVRQLEAQQIRVANDQLKREIELKSRLLANRAMALAQKNKLLLQLRDMVQSERFTLADPAQVRSRITRMVDQNTDHEDEWKVFESNFDEVHSRFTEKLLKSHPNLTSGDKRLAAFIRMDLTSKEIAPLLRISVRSVENKRHRLRKKMNLEFGESLSEYLMRL